MSFLASPRRLARMGVLGMNQRNADFIMRYNPRHLYPLVDNKLLTKQLAIDHGIAVPALYAVVREQHEGKNLVGLLGDHEDFVICVQDHRGIRGRCVDKAHFAIMRMARPAKMTEAIRFMISICLPRRSPMTPARIP